MEKKCCFTGYRPCKLEYLQNEGSAAYKKLYATLQKTVIEATEQGYNYFISGFAEGVDLMAAEIILNLKREGYDLFLEAALPAMNQANTMDNATKGIYYMLLDRADRRVCIEQSMNKYSCLKRDDYMVKEADLVIAVFDGEKGGTAYTIGKARQKKRNLWLINPRNYTITKEEGLFL